MAIQPKPSVAVFRVEVPPMIAPHKAFDVQTTLARVTRLRVDTRGISDSEVYYAIGQTWRFAVDEEQLRLLYNATDSDSEFRAVFEKLKASCLTYNAFKDSMA